MRLRITRFQKVQQLFQHKNFLSQIYAPEIFGGFSFLLSNISINDFAKAPTRISKFRKAQLEILPSPYKYTIVYDNYWYNRNSY